MSIAGMSMSPEQTSATVYTDAYSILQHRNVVEMVLSSCRPMFSDLSMGLGAEAARMLREQGRAGETLFSYLPAPAFMSAGEQLFDDILRDNEITGAAASRLRKSTDSCGAWWRTSSQADKENLSRFCSWEKWNTGQTPVLSVPACPFWGKERWWFHRLIMPEGSGNWPCAWKRFRPTVCFWPQKLTTSVFLP